MVKAWKQREEMRDVIYSTDMSNAMTVSGVAGKVMDYQPDVVYIDAAYLMQIRATEGRAGSHRRRSPTSPGS